ncbi:hypothetical protein FACS1894181_14280 [Bacteroidia bacterium]|nr:hypothetical protein FACS1894181_14280 [Bacteroidia bacterium]
MQNEDDLRGLAKTMEFMRAISILFCVINVYWFCYQSIVDWGVNIGVADRILLNFNRMTGLFKSIVWTKLFAVVFLALSCLGTKGVKAEKIKWSKINIFLFFGFIFFFLNWWLLYLPLPLVANTAFYTLTLTLGYILLLVAGLWMSRLLRHHLMEDVFNEENESFMQETRLMENEYSVNLPTRFYYRRKWNGGWINVVNPFRATIVLGTPGSGKSYAVVNNYIKQHISKGFAAYLYDYKFDDLSVIAYNTLLDNLDKYKVKPQFFVINFDNPRKSHCCNPINPGFMTDISDAYEAAYTIMLNLNRTWIQKQGDFFVESPIILLASIIWYMKIYKGGKYCTFPHAIEFLNKPYADIFTILTSYPELENYLSPFMDAWKSNAQDQLQGQIASAKIPLSRMISPQLYWVMTGDDFTLSINNPSEPKILCVGNIFSGQAAGETAKTLSERFGKILQKRQSLTINRQDTSTSINTQLDSLIPASKIANLSQGMFAGSVADNIEEKIEQKIFHCQIMIDNAKVARKIKAYKPLPVITPFLDEAGNDCMQQQVQHNYNRIKSEVKQIIEEEKTRIKNDPELKHLLNYEAQE